PPPDDPPLLELPPPLELLELGAETPAAIPATAATHAPLAPAPPENPPPPVKLVGFGDALAVLELLEVEIVLWLHVEDCVAVVAWRVDQTSTCLPNPNASSHGYQLSRKSGFDFSRSFRKKLRPAVRRLRKAIASRLCRDFIPLIDEFARHSAHAAIAPAIVHGSSTSLAPAASHRNAAAPRLTTNAGIMEYAAAFGPQAIRARNNHPG